MVNKRLINTGEAVAAFDPLQNFETVTYTGNGGTQKITGYIRKGAAFNGSSSYIDTNFTVPASSTFSISWWQNLSYVGSNEYIFSDYVTSTDDPSFSVYHNGSTIGVLGDGISASTVSTTTIGSWMHFAVVLNGTTLKIYKNGSEIQSRLITARSAAGRRILTIGRLGDFSGHSNFNITGSIDQVRIFDKAISGSEVTTLYNETYDSSTKSTTDIFNDDSGVALYELDEDAGDTGTTPYGTGAIDSGQSAVFANNISRSVITASIPLGSIKTISHYVKFSQFQSDNIHIFSSSSGNLQLGLLNTGANVRSFFFYDGVSTKQFGSSFPNDSNWHHLAWVLNGTNTSLYLDGSLVNTITTASTTQSDIVIGSNTLQSGVIGSIDQVRIYSLALSASDIEALVSETNVPTANLVAHYKLDGNANDETTNYNGTPTSITYSDPAEFPLVQYNGTPTNINFLGMAFQPDLVWIKSRSAVGSHIITDSVRGNGKEIYTDLTNAEGIVNRISLTNIGFDVNSVSYPNQIGNTFVAWCWKAGGAAVLNENGSIDSQVSANPNAGFSIVKYTGTGAAATIGHGLSSAPELIITKGLTTVTNWATYSATLGATKYLILDGTNAAINTSAAAWNNTNPTSSVFSVGSGFSYPSGIAYCFHSVDGYQKVGSYTGNGSDNGPTVTTGFRPRFLLIKNVDDAKDWRILDSLRGMDSSGNINKYLTPNLSSAENTDTNDRVRFDNNGFILITASASFNGLNNTFIYLAIA